MLKSIKFTSLIYYIILLVVLVSWTNVESLPPLPLRMVYMLAVIFPLWIKKSLLFPQVFFTFVIISASLPAVSYMPVDSLYILIVSIISYLLINPKFSNIKLPSSFIVLTVLSLVIDGIFSANCMLSYALMCVMLIARFIPKDNETILKSFIAVFVLVSLVLSFEFVLLGKRFVQSVATQVGQLDRSGWTDPNYFGSIIGYGVVTSSIALFKWQKMKKKYRWFLLGTIIVSLYTILITASRGVFVALAISMFFLILFSNISKKRKLVYLGSGVFIVFLFYALGPDRRPGAGKGFLQMHLLFDFQEFIHKLIPFRDKIPTQDSLCFIIIPVILLRAGAVVQKIGHAFRRMGPYPYRRGMIRHDQKPVSLSAPVKGFRQRSNHPCIQIFDGLQLLFTQNFVGDKSAVIK